MMRRNLDTATDRDAGGQTGTLDVSVVVPSYNHAAFVANCLRSIMRQTRHPRELIVIDDGSSDGSVRVLEQELKNCAFPCELIVVPTGYRHARGLDPQPGKIFRLSGSMMFGSPPFFKRVCDA